jgi:hypothetical protein
MKNITNAGWRTYLCEGRTTAAAGMVELGRRIFEFRKHCESTQGGSAFSEKMHEWLGMSPSTASRWLAIGRKADELLSVGQNLPEAFRVLAQLSKLSIDELDTGAADGVIHPEMTLPEATAYLRKVNNDELAGRLQAKKATDRLTDDDRAWLMGIGFDSAIAAARKLKDERDEWMAKARALEEKLESQGVATKPEVKESLQQVKAAIQQKTKRRRHAVLTEGVVSARDFIAAAASD